MHINIRNITPTDMGENVDNVQQNSVTSEEAYEGKRRLACKSTFPDYNPSTMLHTSTDYK